MRFLFRKVTLDQNIPDILNEREMIEILTPKKEDTTEKFVNKVIESLTNYIRKGGRRTLAQIVGTRVEFLMSIQNILEIKELNLEDIYDIPLPLLMGIITSKMKSSEGLPIEKIKRSVYREKLIEMWRTLSQGEKERFLFRKVTLDQNISIISLSFRISLV